MKKLGLPLVMFCSSLVLQGTTSAAEFAIPISEQCGDIGAAMAPTFPSFHEPKFGSNYAVSLEYIGHDGKGFLAPFPFLGEGFVSRGNNLVRTDFPVQEGNTLKGVPVCTGYSATLLVDPVSDTGASVHLAIEHAYLSQDIMDRRLKSPPFPAAPTPLTTIVDKTLSMKAGDTQNIDVNGDPELASVKVTFSAWKP